MKKTVLASTLAVGLGVTGFAAGNSADAAEQGVDKAQLAQLAQSNPEQLDASPVQEGAYNYNFNHNGQNFNFESDGQNWSWSFGEGSSSSDVSSEQSTTEEQPQQTEQASTEQPVQQAAPQTEQTQQPKQEATTKASTQSSSSNEASSGSSVNVNSHLQAIAQRESGGDLKAVNPSSGAAGKYQFLQSTWDSVAPAEYQGVSPTEAPESVQDQAAMDLYNTAGASQWVTA
ncbi:transglycosylase family protein [Staphylococcus nepalensis]|uniref:transglycosylase family protein n=2 Tax=Staphylococcus nepalensis TaxID=214473 RepID=UPI001E4CB15B|nr:transglycosylase family protein [Staphylococcus nepalensis]MCD8892800.1 transglycosylase family protein [Staphylococcus nepalensis]